MPPRAVTAIASRRSSRSFQNRLAVAFRSPKGFELSAYQPSSTARRKAGRFGSEFQCGQSARQFLPRGWRRSRSVSDASKRSVQDSCRAYPSRSGLLETGMPRWLGQRRGKYLIE